ncbi:hypothetical protein LNQ49_00025 [Flavobacterium sp. F-65]|uniref:Uncharacterized protein n=1 Tax=Flavobacterium pisciphilum TaxID=2893755 RepID=A0ABS8MMK1_9FLAO|nr:hypothetical protein [Flavobacterium sp. F-65]MCC9069989.1 hypothetical protein [Flavobacterium sp. F-65]
MIRVSNDFVKAMEFTSFNKKENVTDDELINAVLKFESILAKQNGVIFHCLVRNFKNEYANILFVSDFGDLKKIEENLIKLPEAQDFFKLIDGPSIKMEYHEVLKTNFKIPSSFSCIECGTFKLKNENEVEQLLIVSENIEKEYLSTFENTKDHFIGRIQDNTYSEITFGETLGKTKEICFGYMSNSFCKPMLEMADETTMKLDFWYLVG